MAKIMAKKNRKKMRKKTIFSIYEKDINLTLI